MNKKKSGPTISDIAKLTNTSLTTVSRVLSNSNYPVAHETYQKVISVASSLGYKINQQKPTHPDNDREITIILPSLTNQFYNILLAGLESTLRALDYDSIIINTNESLQFEKEIISKLLLKPNLKVIIAPVSENINHLMSLVEKSVPLVIMEKNLSPDIPSISVDYFAAGKIITDYMISKGFKNIAFLGAPLTRHTRIQLFEGFKASLMIKGLYKSNLVFLSDPSVATTNPEDTMPTPLFAKYAFNADMSPYFNGAHLANMLIDSNEKVDAIVCNNDITALGVMSRLHQLGFKVPEDISIAGSDNIFASAISYPGLSTVDQCTYEIGGMAANMLHSRLTDPSFKPIEVVLKPNLVIRETIKLT